MAEPDTSQMTIQYGTEKDVIGMLEIKARIQTHS